MREILQQRRRWPQILLWVLVLVALASLLIGIGAAQSQEVVNATLRGSLDSHEWRLSAIEGADLTTRMKVVESTLADLDRSLDRLTNWSGGIAAATIGQLVLALFDRKRVRASDRARGRGVEE